MSDSEFASTRSCWGQLAGRSGMEVEDEDEVEDEGEEKQDNGKGKEKVKKDKVGKEGKEEVQKDKRGKGKNGKGKGGDRKRFPAQTRLSSRRGCRMPSALAQLPVMGLKLSIPGMLSWPSASTSRSLRTCSPRGGRWTSPKRWRSLRCCRRPRILCCCGQVGKQSK